MLYTSAGSAVWSSKTNGTGANKAAMQDDGNFVLYTASNAAVWSTNTAQAVGGTGGGSTSGSISHVGTTQIWDADGQGVKITRPAAAQAGDLLVLVLHRTDDLLPFGVSGWNRQAECYKENNGYQCLNVSDCSSTSGGFCTRFQNKYNGRDLAQVVFTRTAMGMPRVCFRPWMDAKATCCCSPNPLTTESTKRYSAHPVA
ncbi:MAG: hypothetical protein IPM37_07530 [Hahellaceae bacterium]|nr:hypothetical protein [Hahellaceae bacterium]